MITEQLYFNAKSIEEAIIEANNNIDNFQYIAGGTDVIVNKFQGNDDAKVLIDISGIRDLKQITTKENHIEIGSLIKLDDKKFNIAVRPAEYLCPELLRCTHFFH